MTKEETQLTGELQSTTYFEGKITGISLNIDGKSYPIVLAEPIDSLKGNGLVTVTVSGTEHIVLPNGELYKKHALRATYVSRSNN